ncbi:hypothetical protein ACOYQJ_17935 [Primorskyibacter sp. 2E233]
MLRSVREKLGCRKVVWHHIALETHDLLLAENCVAESLFFGPMVLPGLTWRESGDVERTLLDKSVSKAAHTNKIALP